MKVPTICILYGLNEGQGIGRAFEAACKQYNLQIVRDARTADIVFAHSGGCLLVPPDNQAKIVMQVGIPYWPSRPWSLAIAIKLWREIKSYHRDHRLQAWARKLAWHAYYAPNIVGSLRMLRNLSPTRPWNSTQHQIIIRNRHDACCTPQVHQLHYNGPRTFISFPGEHDDCWEHPERYLDLIQSVYE